MNDKITFPIVIDPIPTNKERFLGLLLIAFIFIPFIYGVFTSQGVYCLSLPVGIFGIMTFHLFTDEKFTTSKIIQRNKFISFDENGLEIFENDESVFYHWNELEKIEINLIAFKGKWKDEDGRYDGIENYIAFAFQNVNLKYLFYVDKPKEFNFLWDYLEKIILPKLYESKIIKDESIIISQLDYAALQRFKTKYNINRYTDFIYFN
ncbi:hypothetical protein [Flavobacterium sp. KACC 22761]|uniref:hypothetical protein n=1 Tax=Flavobacterium sp. KACC 22761 TaxID=3092665 RepID=UPI002A74F0E9|nr:hypothetical protein [Flavobacterium sp. KACC 22761]WPO79636.1 hypothetical protein SCB73_04470 [Flavobacterium sp. KACC 22761]